MSERIEYALDYGAGITCISRDASDAEEMQQFIPGAVVVQRTVFESDWTERQ